MTWRGWIVYIGRRLGFALCQRAEFDEQGNQGPWRLAFQRDDMCRPVYRIT